METDKIIAWDRYDEESITTSELHGIIESQGIGHLFKFIQENKHDLDWRLVWSILVYIQTSRNYNPAWLVYKFDEIKPPLEVWQQLALYLNYKTGWAYHRFQESQQEPEKNTKQNRKKQSQFH
jgi:hypothetical protein